MTLPNSSTTTSSASRNKLKQNNYVPEIRSRTLAIADTRSAQCPIPTLNTRRQVAAESNEYSQGDNRHVYNIHHSLNGRKRRRPPAGKHVCNGSTRPLRARLSKLRGSKGVTGHNAAEKQHKAARKGAVTKYSTFNATRLQVCALLVTGRAAHRAAATTPAPVNVGAKAERFPRKHSIIFKANIHVPSACRDGRSQSQACVYAPAEGGSGWAVTGWSGQKESLACHVRPCRQLVFCSCCASFVRRATAIGATVGPPRARPQAPRIMTGTFPSFLRDAPDPSVHIIIVAGW